MTTKIPLSLYIHIPWCEKKCPYCDFNSHLAKTKIDEDAYVDALLEDLSDDLLSYKTEVNDRYLSSIFIGGGTPSLFSAKSFKRLLSGVKERIEFSDTIEVTSEANPGSSEAGKFEGFREAGVNRLSIGIQSFNQTYLKALGRVHNQDEALKAAGYAKQAGFDNFNLDLMFGLPNQSHEHAVDDVLQAIDLNPTHLSCYQLTIEPNTLFHHRPPVTPDDDVLWDMQEAIQAQLQKANYQQYEVSAYAQPNKRCAHNLNYWQFGDYLGIGAGAHGKLSGLDGQVVRMWKIKHPTNYLNPDKKFTGGIDYIEPEQQVFEFMMNALRLREGFDLSLFEARTPKNSTDINFYLAKHQSQGLVEVNNNRVIPTERGCQMLDSMLQDYLVDA